MFEFKEIQDIMEKICGLHCMRWIHEGHEQIRFDFESSYEVTAIENQ